MKPARAPSVSSISQKIMTKKSRTKKSKIQPTTAAGGSNKPNSVTNGGQRNGGRAKLDDREYDDFLEYVFLSPSTAVVLAEAITWSEILEG